MFVTATSNAREYKRVIRLVLAQRPARNAAAEGCVQTDGSAVHQQNAGYGKNPPAGTYRVSSRCRYLPYPAIPFLTFDGKLKVMPEPFGCDGVGILRLTLHCKDKLCSANPLLPVSCRQRIALADAPQRLADGGQ